MERRDKISAKRDEGTSTRPPPPPFQTLPLPNVLSVMARTMLFSGRRRKVSFGECGRQGGTEKSPASTTLYRRLERGRKGPEDKERTIYSRKFYRRDLEGKKKRTTMRILSICVCVCVRARAYPSKLPIFPQCVY